MLASLMTLLAATLQTHSQVTFAVKTGLVIPNDNLPWALDSYEGLEELVPIHRSTVNVKNHVGENFVGGLTQSLFYKPKTSTELPGVRARTVLHDSHPSFYLHVTPSDDDEGNPSSQLRIVGWAIIKGRVGRTNREFQEVRITVLTNHAQRSNPAVEVEVVQLAGGWLRLTPKTALESGEYAIAPLFKSEKYFSAVLFDFSLDPAGPNAGDAVPSSAPESRDRSNQHLQ
jgi:hypothetical protein